MITSTYFNVIMLSFSLCGKESNLQSTLLSVLDTIHNIKVIIATILLFDTLIS